MDIEAMYAYLSKEFLRPGIIDSWVLQDPVLVDDHFLQTSIGTMYSFTQRVDRLFTAVFLSPVVVRELQRLDVSDALLVTHHPLGWTMQNYPAIFEQIPPPDVHWLRQRRIGVYVLHAPLDVHMRLGTSTAFCEAIGLPVEGYTEGSHHFGILSSSDTPLEILAGGVASAVGHPVRTYRYGAFGAAESLPPAQRRGVAIISGGVVHPDIIDAVADAGASAIITGVTRRMPNSEMFHAAAQQRGVSLVGATHYSSEKFGCMRLAEDAAQLGIPTSFIEESPQFDDL